MSKKLAPFLLCTTLFLGGLFLGDRYQPIKTVSENMKFHNRVANQDTPSDYSAWYVEPLVNDSGLVDLYLSNSEESYKINKNLQVNCPVCPEIEEKKLGKYIDDYFNAKFSEFEKSSSGFSKEILSDLKEAGYNLKDLVE